jgi:hypothetical protein
MGLSDFLLGCARKGLFKCLLENINVEPLHDGLDKFVTNKPEQDRSRNHFICVFVFRLDDEKSEPPCLRSWDRKFWIAKKGVYLIRFAKG